MTSVERARIAFLTVSMATAACQHPDLASTNVVNALGGGPLASADPVVAAGVIDVNSATVAGISQALAAINPSADILVNPATDIEGCVKGVGEACLTVHYDTDPQTLPNLVETAFGTVPSELLPSFPLAGPWALVEELRAPAAQGTPFFIDVTVHPQPVVAQRFRWELVTPEGEDIPEEVAKHGKIGLWVPITFEFDRTSSSTSSASAAPRSRATCPPVSARRSAPKPMGTARSSRSGSG